jgi:hypothetical protein
VDVEAQYEPFSSGIAAENTTVTLSVGFRPSRRGRMTAWLVFESEVGTTRLLVSGKVRLCALNFQLAMVFR